MKLDRCSEGEVQQWREKKVAQVKMRNDHNMNHMFCHLD